MSRERVRVAVVGVGHLGQHHARIYAEHPGAELAAVVDTDPGRGGSIARKFGTRLVGDFRELLEIPGLRAVSIAVPTVGHYEIARAMLERGIHCLVEKPITNTVKQASELVTIANSRGLILQVGHIERFNAAVQRLRELIDRPRFIEVHRLGPYDPRVKDVGVVLDLMIHDIDIIMQVVDAPIQNIESLGVAIFSEKEDIANARITFANGCIANITVSRVTPVKKRKLRLFQPDCYISINYAKQSMEVFRRITVPNAAPGAPNVKIVRKSERLKREEPLKKEIDHFLECVEKGVRPHVTGEHGMSALEVAIKITEQIRAAALAPDGGGDRAMMYETGEFVGFVPLTETPAPSVYADIDADEVDDADNGDDDDDE